MVRNLSRALLFFTGLGLPLPARAQTYDLLLAGGHVIDPANGIDDVMDVAVSGNRIARVAKGISRADAKKTVDVGGFYVSPGLIDLHAHVIGVFADTLLPDDTALVTGVTTAVDAGGAGWRNFEEFKAKTIDKSKTRVLAFLNIVGRGMGGWQIENDVDDMDPEATAKKIKQYPDLLVGIKNAHFGLPGWAALDRAVQAGRLSGTPVMVDDKVLTNTGRTSREKLLDHLRPGDLHTHCFNDRHVEIVDRFRGNLTEPALEARKRGVLFDMGHGAGSFLWPVASRALAQNFLPDTISTDLHASSILIQQSDMPNCISKMMGLGMKLQDAIARSTVNSARAIHRFPELGTLTPGKTADIAVFALRNGVFAFKDSWGMKLLGRQKLECVMTIRDGRIVFDDEGLSWPVWSTAGNYEVIQ